MQESRREYRRNQENNGEYGKIKKYQGDKGDG